MLVHSRDCVIMMTSPLPHWNLFNIKKHGGCHPRSECVFMDLKVHPSRGDPLNARHPMVADQMNSSPHKTEKKFGCIWPFRLKNQTLFATSMLVLTIQAHDSHPRPAYLDKFRTSLSHTSRLVFLHGSLKAGGCAFFFHPHSERCHSRRISPYAVRTCEGHATTVHSLQFHV